MYIKWMSRTKMADPQIHSGIRNLPSTLRVANGLFHWGWRWKARRKRNKRWCSKSWRSTWNSPGRGRDETFFSNFTKRPFLRSLDPLEEKWKSRAGLRRFWQILTDSNRSKILFETQNLISGEILSGFHHRRFPPDQPWISPEAAIATSVSAAHSLENSPDPGDTINLTDQNPGIQLGSHENCWCFYGCPFHQYVGNYRFWRVFTPSQVGFSQPKPENMEEHLFHLHQLNPTKRWTVAIQKGNLTPPTNQLGE